MTKDKILQSKWISWIGPSIKQPHLWEWSRTNVALGAAIGVCFGLLVPVAQIPIAVIACIFMRANILAACLSTLISNPITYWPIYYGAYKLGGFFTGHDAVFSSIGQLDLSFLGYLAAVGKPLYLGLFISAIFSSTLVYLCVNFGWKYLNKFWKID